MLIIEAPILLLYVGNWSPRVAQAQGSASGRPFLLSCLVQDAQPEPWNRSISVIRVPSSSLSRLPRLLYNHD